LKKFRIASILLIVLLVFFPAFQSLAVNEENNSGRKLNSVENKILQDLVTTSQNLKLDSNEVDNLLTKETVEMAKAQSAKGKVQVQIFELINNTEVVNTIVKSVKELDSIVINAPADIAAENKDKSFYKVPYTVIISTPRHLGVFDFDQFYINDLTQMTEEEKFGVVDYITLNNLHKMYKVNFVKVENKHAHLENNKGGGDISTQCIACVDYTLKSSTPTTEWTNVAQVHAIKGVNTEFSLSTSASSTTSIQVKTVYKNGTVEVSGSSSVTYSRTENFPVRSATSLTASGRWAQTQIKYSKQVWGHPNGNEYTKKSATSFVGGQNWGGYVGGNGASFYNVSGSEFFPGGSTIIEHTSAKTNTTGVSLSAYGVTTSLSGTVNSSTGIKWKFIGLTGQGYAKYKIYNSPTVNNLTAR
jgi:hypothetical protein